MFLPHITTRPDNINTMRARAFGVMFLLLVLVIANLNDNMMSMDRLLQMQH